jgi:predicted nucleic acid-binding protein
VFFDTSALTKRYVEEEGSDQVRALCAEADALGVSVLVVPELISTLCRLVREGRLSPEDYRSLKSALQADLSDADLCDLSQDAFDQALLCLERHPLRALDALHVGSALVYSRSFSSPRIAGKPKHPGRKGSRWWISLIEGKTIDTGGAVRARRYP